MRRLAVTVTLACLATVASVLSPTPGSTQPAPPDLPAGFTDGTPVGGPTGPDGAAPGPTEAPSASTTRAASGQRYFGRDPWNAIRAAASAAARPCSISNDGVTGLVASPVFKESSAATSAASAPAPMTLSRYDEWSGTFGTNSNRNANYGLYAFRNPSTSYKRAYWHAGIGIWQYDTSGVGAGYTATERMDVRIIAADVAKGVVSRYCSPSPGVVGHGAPFTDQERRYAAWTPWGYPCTLCEASFQRLLSTTPHFSAVTLVNGISVMGGAQPRSCTLLGDREAVPCWYVDPRPGVVEGATAWATLTPLDGGSPTSSPTPLAAPFYVVDRGATEERHWLHEDTGYSIDISGSRQVGKNDRPRSNQAGSGITWTSGSGLCDLTTGHGACLPAPPAGVSLAVSPIGGTFRPIALDAQGDGKGDILWYAPGSGQDYLWNGTGSGGFSSVQITSNGTYDDVLPLDVDGDGDDDVLWYNRTTGVRYLWVAEGLRGFRAVRLPTTTGLRPTVVDTDGNGQEELFWYGPGSLPDSLWRWTGSAFAPRAQSVGGGYLGIPGDFDGDRRTDLIWYAPGAAPDHLWLSTGFGTHRDVPISASGSYWPLVGDYDGNGADDLVWYGPGVAPDSAWFGGGFGFQKATVSVGGSYQPVVADVEGDGRDDLIWYQAGAGTDPWWRWSSTRVRSASAVSANGPHRAVVGGFSAGGADGIFWYAPGHTPDGTWYH